MSLRPLMRSFLATLDEPAFFVRHHLRRLYPTALVVSLIVAAFGVANQLATLRANTTLAPEDMLLVYAMAALMGLASLVLQVAVYDVVAGVRDGEAPRMGRALARSLGPRRAVAMVLYGIAVSLGMLCCCLPGIAAGIAFALLPAVLVRERCGPLSALGRSAQLVAFRPGAGLAPTWLRVLGVWTAVSLVNAALYSIGSAPIGFLGAIWTVRRAASGEVASPQAVQTELAGLQIAATVVGAFASALGTLYAASAFDMLFRQTRELREAPELEESLARRERWLEAGGEAPHAGGGS